MVKKKANTEKVIEYFKKKYPSVKCSLSYQDDLQLLVAVMLSAQCTDERVNIVTKNLLKKYKNAKDFAETTIQDLEKAIYSTGFYKNKAKNIKSSAQLLLDKYRGVLPKTINEMVKLPGVGRKTANVVLGNAFGIVEGIAVDTHVKRLSQKYGFSKSTNPVQIEKDLMKIFPKKDWFKLIYLLIEHGRNIRKTKNDFISSLNLY